MKAFLLSTLSLFLAASAADTDYKFMELTGPRTPGLIQGGNMRSIKIEGFYDLLCSNCTAFHPIFNDFLKQEYSDPIHGTVPFLDLVQVHYNFMPLTFHYMTWNVHLIVPYLLARCERGDICRFHDYIEWCAKHRSEILGMKDHSHNEIVKMLQTNVISEFPEIDQAEIEAIWTDSDPYNSNFMMVEQKRLATSRKVCDTPTLFVNGVKLNPTPLTTEEWAMAMDTLIKEQDAITASITVVPTVE
jgi:hypothetical protein